MMPAKGAGAKAATMRRFVVDAGSHMVVDFMSPYSPSDRGPDQQKHWRCKEELGLEAVSVIADKGLWRAKDIRKCLRSGVVADGFIQDQGERCFRWTTTSERDNGAKWKASAKT